MVDAGPRPPSVVPLCVHARNAVKALLDRCCMSDATDFAGYIDRNCDELYGPSFAAGRMVPNAAGESQCFAALDAAANNTACTSYKDGVFAPYSTTAVNQVDSVAHAFAPCTAVMKGTVAAAGECLLDSDCLDGLTCVGATPFEDHVTFGKCQAPASIGGACGVGATSSQAAIRVHAPIGDHPECAQGFCDTTQCAATKASGASCFDDRECSTGLSCIDDTCTNAALPKLGETCTYRCADDGAFCFRPGGAATGVCTKGRVSGESCEADGDCAGQCNVPNGGTLGTCASQCGSN